MQIKTMTEKELNDIAFIHHGHKELNHSLFMEVKNAPFLPKPMFGFWGSKYTPREKFLSSWHDFFIDGFSPEIVTKFNSGYFTFKIKPTANIIKLNSLLDLKIVEKKYRYETESLLDFNRLDWVSLDWEKIAKDYDGCYVTEEGIEQLYNPLYGWDVESIVLFNLDCVEE